MGVEGGAKFPEILRVSPFNKDLSNENTLSQIQLADHTFEAVLLFKRNSYFFHS